MMVLLISNMYPSDGNYSGVFIKSQEEALLKSGVGVIKRVLKKRTILQYLKFYVGCIFDIIFLKYDVIHAHYGFHCALIPAIIRRNKKLVTTFHGSDIYFEPLRNRIYNFFQMITVKRSDKIIAVSREIKRKIIDKYGVAENKIEVLSCGVDTKTFRRMDKDAARKELCLNGHKFIVLFVGNLTLWKGIDIVCRCAELLADVTFVAVGKGKMPCGFDNIVHAGVIENEMLFLWYNAADLLLFPSRSEGTPVTLLEAMSCGLPIISSDVGGCKDLIEEGKNGYLINVRANPVSKYRKGTNNVREFTVSKSTINDIKNKISLLLNDRDLGCEMGNMGMDFVRRNFHNEIIARKLVEIYKHIGF